MVTASTNRSPDAGSGAAISLSPAAKRVFTAGCSGSDDSNTGASSPSYAGRAAGNDQGTLTGISSVYWTSPVSKSIASTGTSEGRRGSTRTTVMSPVAYHSLPHLRTSLYQHLPGVFHRGPTPNRRPWRPGQDHESVAPQLRNLLAESAPARSTWLPGNAHPGTAASVVVAESRPAATATAVA